MKEPLSNLRISDIFGSSSNSRNCIAIAENLIAYAASGGVVVSQLDGGSQITKQRFFCASSKPQKYEPKSNASVFKDEFGLIKPEHSIIIKGDTWNDADDSTEKTITIGSDLSPAKCSPSKIKDRIKTISCLSLSPDGKFLIVGETGHQPRILLYSMASDSNQFPVFVVHQHSYGISHLQFHPEDGTIFASLGLINDGFLHIWKLTSNGVRLVASNKNSTIVNGMKWYKDSAIITYGVRQMKVWKFENPKHNATSKIPVVRTRTAIKGKNILLRSLIECSFLDCDFLKDDQLLFLTDSNQIVLYNNGSLVSTYDLDDIRQCENIAVDWDKDKLWLSYSNNIESIPLTNVLNHQDILRPGSESFSSRSNSPIKTNLLDGKLTDSIDIAKGEETIFMMKLLPNNELLYCTSKGEISLLNETGSQITNASLHDISVFKKADDNCAIVCSKEGDMKLFDGICLKEVQANIGGNLICGEITAIDIDQERNTIAIGDSVGNIYVFQDGTCELQKGIHNASINDVKIYRSQEVQIIITISRDRKVQFMKKRNEEWAVFETVNENKGNLLQLEISNDKLFIISSDRTLSSYRLVIVEDKINVLKEAILSIKSSPIRMQVTKNEILISRADKIIQIIDKSSYETTRVLKLFEDQGDGILASHFYVNIDSDQIICSSSLDKILRCFNYNNGKFINQYFAHSDPIVGLDTINGKFVTITNNGCVFSWEMQQIDSSNDNIKLPTKAHSNKSTLSSPCTPVKVNRALSPLKFQHLTPSSTPLHKENPIVSPMPKGIIPSDKLQVKRSDSQSLLKLLRSLRISIENDEDIEGILDIKREISLIQDLLEPRSEFLNRFGEQMLELISRKLEEQK